MIYRFIDTHCHLNFPPFSGDEEAGPQRVTQAGVGKIIVSITKAEDFTRVLALAGNYQPLYAALGLHSGMLEKHSDVSPEQLQQILRGRPAKVVTVGEIGLDLFGDDPQFERQQQLLDEQLKPARHYDLSAILHSRRAHDKLTIHFKCHDSPRTDVVHGLSGSLQQAERFVQLGYKIGVGDTITYPHANETHDVIAKLPLASSLLGTDAPDMPPNDFQGQFNHPEQTARVFVVLYELRRGSADEIAQALLNNMYTLFNIPQAG